MSKRRIILLLDGTWNDEIGGNRSNIIRLRDLIASSLDPMEPDPSSIKTQVPEFRANVGPRTFEGRQYIVFYQRGVGTGPFDRFRGGGLGLGLELNIRRAYRFVSFHYRPGDEIFVFGFSRGAYTARSLTGYIGAVGLLRCETCTAAREALAWSFYRTPPNDRIPGVWKELEPDVHPRDSIRVACLAMFDTVGALGIPLHVLDRLNRRRYEFHDVELSSLVDIALHALAIDEHRRPFQAALWRRNKFKRTTARIEQVWFPGVHADIGGGYFDDAERKAGVRELDDLALDWMIKRLRAHFPGFPITEEAWTEVADDADLGPQHDSRSWKYKFWRRAIRSIGNRPLPETLFSWRDVPVGCDSHDRAVNESIHIRAIRRVGTPVRIGGGESLYAPANLLSCLPALGRLYATGEPAIAADTLKVTALNGAVVEPDSGLAGPVLAELNAAGARLRRQAPDLLKKIDWVVPEQ